MAQGFIVDRGHGASYVAGWHPGEPDRRWWGLKADRKQTIGISVYRCDRCGFLESYAVQGN